MTASSSRIDLLRVVVRRSDASALNMASSVWMRAASVTGRTRSLGNQPLTPSVVRPFHHSSFFCETRISWPFSNASSPSARGFQPHLARK
jgi:hypothetical protein